METYFQLKHSLKTVRWQVRRKFTALRWGHSTLNRMPAVFGNAMPKSGSHLIIQILQGLIKIGPFVNTGFPPVNRAEDNQKLPHEKVMENILRMKPGDIAYGYVQASESFIEIMTKPTIAMIFVYRDPRDMIISHVFYATDIHKGHGMHPYYTEVLKSIEERIDAQIFGVELPGYELSSVLIKYQAYLDWLTRPEVLSIRFEDLILNRDEALGEILDYLVVRGFVPGCPRRESIDMLKSGIAPSKSGTFRKGKPGNWREHFTKSNIDHFKTATGDLLIRLGYEQDQNWG